MYYKIYFVQMSLRNVSCDEAFVCIQRSWCQSSRRNPPAKRVRTTLDRRRDSKLRSAKQDAQVRNAKKTFKNTLRLRAVPLSSSPSSVAEKKRKKRKPLDASLFFQLFSSHDIRTKQKGDYITYKNFRTFLVKFRTCNYWTLNRISDKFRRR